MARVFLDTNTFVDLYVPRSGQVITKLVKHRVFISSLSIHILLCVLKQKVPLENLNELLERMTIINFTEKIVRRGLRGPTRDFEDNVQLHSATEADANFFLTSDKRLLRLKFFGETEVVSSLPGNITS